ncbi:MAG: hypothetical protein U9O55_02780 [Patescibacteria group bacterium]|nr:hypothetical protein [Patescibacteria group bacterium]
MIGSGTGLPARLMSLLNEERGVKNKLKKIFDTRERKKLEFQLKDIRKRKEKITGRYNYSAI